jgi:hypothetical protein
MTYRVRSTCSSTLVVTSASDDHVPNIQGQINLDGRYGGALYSSCGQSNYFIVIERSSPAIDMELRRTGGAGRVDIPKQLWDVWLPSLLLVQADGWSSMRTK